MDKEAPRAYQERYTHGWDGVFLPSVPWPLPQTLILYLFCCSTNHVLVLVHMHRARLLLSAPTVDHSMQGRKAQYTTR